MLKLPSLISVVFIFVLFLSCSDDSSLNVKSDEENVNPYEFIAVEDFYGLEIDRDNHHLQLYDLKNVEDIAAQYKESGMLWFAGSGVNYDILDENMVPVLYEIPGEVTRNPNQIAHFSFGFYKYYHVYKEEKYKQWFLNNVHWLMENCDDLYYLHYTYEWTHHPDAPTYFDDWVSGMAQGEALAAFCMAYHLTGDEKYLHYAENIFVTLYRNSDSFWCFGVDPEGYYWLEEYPNDDFCHVLNGMMLGMWGLWDYYIISSDEFALTLFEAGIKSIVDHLSIWNIEGMNGTRYCLHYKHNNKNYHSIHLELFQLYADFFDIPEFKNVRKFFSH